VVVRRKVVHQKLYLPAVRKAGEGANPMAETAIRRTRSIDLYIFQIVLFAYILCIRIRLEQ
jgi:hypothetical protein